MKYTTTILAFSIHREDDHPIFGETATHVRVEDDAGGPYIELQQSPDDVQLGVVRLDYQEIGLITAAAARLFDQPSIKKAYNESNPDHKLW